MNVEDLRAYCLAKPAVSEGFPFGGSTLVFKVAGKMFALMDLDFFEYANLKCDPEYAIELRERYSGITPGWHMSKVHWNSVSKEIPNDLFYELVDQSYDLVVKSLTKKQREEYDLN